MATSTEREGLVAPSVPPTVTSRAATAGLEILPRRIFLAGLRRPVYDSDGFVLPSPASEILSAADLLRHSAVLVVAPPWTGKTYIAEQLERAIQFGLALPDLTFQFFELTSFERLGATVEPAWWSAWKSGSERACWILDAIDEDERRGRRIGEVLTLLERLPKQDRSRLHLLFLCRVNEVPAPFQQRLIQLFGEWSQQRPEGLRRILLAGVDRDAAKELLGDRFDHVGQLIRENRLAELACLPAVLEYLRDRQETSLTREQVWRGVLEGMLRDKRRREPEFEIEDSFKVVQRVAAVLTFSGTRGFGIEAPSPDAVSLESLLLPEDPEYRVLRKAARAVVTTAVFERAECGFRFAQDHVREWCAAFALRDMPLLKLRPLLTDESGELNSYHRGLMGILHQISPNHEVKDWIASMHGSSSTVTSLGTTHFPT